jgi:hypothetical protein
MSLADSKAVSHLWKATGASPRTDDARQAAATAAGVDIRTCSPPTQGVGIFALRDYAEGELVWRERPLAGIRLPLPPLPTVDGGAGDGGDTTCTSSASGADAAADADDYGGEEEEDESASLRTCDACMRWIGSPRAQLRRVDALINPCSTSDSSGDVNSGGDVFIGGAAADDDSSAELPSWPESLRAAAQQPVECERGCGAVFCSDVCRVWSDATYHRLLCAGNYDLYDDDSGKNVGTSSSSSSNSTSSAADDSTIDDAATVATRRSLAHPLRRFEQHCRATNEQLALAARSAAMAAVRLVENTDNTVVIAAATGGEDGGKDGDEDGDDVRGKAAALADAALGPFTRFHQGDWCVAVPVPFGADVAAFRASQQQLLGTASLLLINALTRFIDDAPTPAVRAALLILFSAATLSRLMAAFELNCLGVCARSPLTEYHSHLSSLPTAESAAARTALGETAWVALSALSDFAADDDDDDDDDNVGDENDGGGGGGDDLNDKGNVDGGDDDDDGEGGECYGVSRPEGTGLFLLACCANHSCAPNIAVIKAVGDFDDTAAFVAQSDIRAGDELCISYIDEDNEVADRRDALSDYGFHCECVACVADEAGGSDDDKAAAHN